MTKLYIDANSGVAGDMVLDALIGLGADPLHVAEGIKALRLETYPGSDTGHEHEAEHVHKDEEGHIYTHTHALRHRTFYDVKNIIGHAAIDESVKKTAIGIYTVIASAEAAVHDTKRIMVEFHEVGRDRAISHVTGVALALDDLGINTDAGDEIFVSDIVDGTGTVMAAHGRMTVPVPAVRKMAEQNGITIRQEMIPMEMITPTGLGMVIGMGARQITNVEMAEAVKGASFGVGRGTRDTGKQGLRIFII
jgi:Uncharacterized conserved protein